MINCYFSEPKDYQDNAPTTEKDIWAFSKMDCVGSLDYSTSTLPVSLEKMTSQDEQKDFFLEKTISYGDFLITSFFILLILGLAVFGIRDFVKNRKLERL